MYSLICKTCGKKFEHQSQFKRLCSECEGFSRRAADKRSREKRKLKKTRDISIDQMVSIIEEYNRKHGTKYTYGQFVELAESGKIKVKIKEAEN